MIWSVLILIGVAAALPFLAERRKPDMDDATRAQAPGQFADLSDGKTHFGWAGPKNGPVLVCIHGLTTPAYVFNALISGLVERGFRVLTYDLYGRGFSDRPRAAQTRHLFIRQLRDLLQDQGISGDITLLGYSMGGSIATVFAFEEPERVSRLILCAPAGLVHRPDSLAKLTRAVPGLGEWLTLTIAGRSLRRASRRQQAHTSIVLEMSQRQETEVARRGYLPSVLSSQRNMLAETLAEEHRAIANAEIPVLAIWGELDTVIPLQALGRLTENNRPAHQSVIKGAGHGVIYTHPTEVLGAIDSFMNSGRDET